MGELQTGLRDLFALLVTSAHDHMNTGAAYVFRDTGSTWEEEHELFYAAGGGAQIEGHKVLVGSSNRDRVDVFDLTLAVDVYPDQVRPQHPLTFHTCDALPGSPVFLFVVDVNGVPIQFLVATGIPGADYSWRQTMTVPSGLSGLTVGVVTIGLDGRGDASISGREVVLFR